MYIIPKGKPVITNLNSYYLKIEKLVEHFQGELGSGGVFFASATGKGVLFFDEFEIVNGYLQNKAQELSGPEAIQFLLAPPAHYNFNVSIYAIEPENVYFWTQIPAAHLRYDDLSSEFTDIEALIKKMAAERLTGYLDVALGGAERGLLFFQNGQIVGDSLSWQTNPHDQNDQTESAQDRLVQKTRTQGGVFRVYEIPVAQKSNPRVLTTAELQPALRVVSMLSDLLSILETLVAADKRIHLPFNTLLKKQWVEMADQYPFLDPFAGELNYSNQALSFLGEASDHQLAAAVTQSVDKIAANLGLKSALVELLAPWFKKYHKEIKQLGLNLAKS
jgi:hypothetical protein